MANSEAVLKKCETQGATTKDAFKKANAALENVEDFKDVWRQINNQMLDNIGKQMGARTANAVAAAASRGNNLEMDLIRRARANEQKPPVYNVQERKTQEKKTICNCGPTGNAHFKTADCIDQ